jgi:hypothetical protein
MADKKDKPKNAGGGRGFINPPTIGEQEMIDQYNEQKRNEAEKNAPTTKTEMGKMLKKGGSVSSASKRADGIAQRGKTRA